jgi:D-alanyl-D-alanine carboxypeptidase/D-alanyl-D-alanine-endopeptidase (penicillin-binding protein 4)
MPDAYGRARRWAAIALLAPAFVPVSAQAASRDGHLRRELKREWRAAGRASGAYVWDATHRHRVFSARSATARPIGSNAQLFTGGAALSELGAATTLPTEALATTPVDDTGTLPGDLFLRGSGDPTLDRPQIEALVDQITAAGVRKVTGSVVGDGTRFDAVRTGPTGNGVFDPELGGVLGALVYQRGRQADGGEFQRDPDRAAAFRLDDALEARGVVIVGIPHAGATPAGAVLMAGVSSPPVGALVVPVLRESDNYVAEMLTKAIAARTALPGTTMAGAAAVATAASEQGAQVALLDGSGLDAHDRAAPREIVDLLRGARQLPPFAAALPVAGQTGTLVGRLAVPPAAGRCQAKTGTLPAARASALSGWCRTRRGRTLVFSLLVTGKALARERATQDAMVQLLAGDRRPRRDRAKSGAGSPGRGEGWRLLHTVQ